MNLKITAKTPEALLARIKIEADLSYDAKTPSKADVAQSLSKSLGKPANLIVVDRIDNKYGKHEAKVHAFAYESDKIIGMTIKEGKKTLEKKKKLQEAEAAKTAEAQKAEKKE